MPQIASAKEDLNASSLRRPPESKREDGKQQSSYLKMSDGSSKSVFTVVVRR